MLGRGLIGALLAAAWLAGCAATPAWRAGEGAVETACRAQLAAFDAAVGEAGVADAGSARIDGFPYLRTDRLLASFAPELGQAPDSPRYRDWLARQRALDADARRIEAANLPVAARERLTDDPAAAANACGERLLAAELLGPEDAPARAALRAAVEAPDHYIDRWRVLGLYPLSRIGLALGYEGWKAGYLVDFGQPRLPPGERWRRYAPVVDGAPLSDEAAARLVRRAPRTPLGLLAPDAATLARLATHHAPVFVIATASHDDRLGSPRWRRGPAGPLPAVDTTRPVADVRLAHTRFEGQVLPQLVYTVWFPARTRRGALDLLGGRLDGLVWRLTLGDDGRPLIYDSIHPCGCYHLFFPVPPLERVAVPADRDLREAPLTPAAAPRLAQGERLHLRVASLSHYLEDVAAGSAAPAGAIRYALRPVSAPPAYGRRSLALPDGGRRSLFDARGLVPTTERLERWLLWPAGIRSPGAMRQWGTHATVFVGRRHFDDPFLFEEAFARP